MKNKSEKSILDDNRVVAAASLVIAVFIWVIVIAFISPDSDTTLHGIPVNFSYDSSKYTGLGLDIVNEPEYTVSVKLEGNRATIGQIKSSDFVVYPDYSTVKTAGSNRLNLIVRFLNSQYTSSITATVSGSTKTVDVVFDTVAEKSFAITVEANDLTLAENYVLNKAASAPGEVTLRGPQSEIDLVDKVVASVTVDEELSDSKVIPVALELRSADGMPLDLQYTTMDNESADVTLSVYLMKQLPLTVNFINVPAGFDLDSLSYRLSQTDMLVSGPSRQMEELTELSVASFDFSTFALGKDFQLPVQLPTGLVSQDGLTSVTLSFDTNGLAEKTLNISNIRVINQPSSYSLSVQSDKLNNVTLIGPESDLEKLMASNVVAQIDCQEISVTEGQQNVPVQVLVPSSSSIFAVGSYTVQCAITQR